jgi:hypothetical protein
MRKIVTACFYSLMIGGGAYLLLAFLVHGGTAVTTLAVGATLALFGGYMLWSDFFSNDRL